MTGVNGAGVPLLIMGSYRAPPEQGGGLYPYRAPPGLEEGLFSCRVLLGDPLLIMGSYRAPPMGRRRGYFREEFV